jgi:GntR family transcriptional regulator, arabinose operon transcriptional repressor
VTDWNLSDICLSDVQNGQPKYEQLKAQLVNAVVSGHLRPGQNLPSEQTLAETIQIARSTVRQALASLERDGLVRRVHGKGTFIHEEAHQRLKRGLDLFALLVPETQTGFYPSLQRSFDEAACQVHNQVIACNTGNNVDRQGNIILQLMDKQVAGVAIVPTTAPPTPAYQITQLQKRGIPVVFCSRRVDGVRAPLLAIAFKHVGAMAAQAALEHGHRRAAFFSTNRSQAAIGYQQGFGSTFRAGGGILPDEFVYCGSSLSPDVAKQEARLLDSLKRMFSKSDPPTVIFASFDTLAESLFLQLMRLKLRVPEDVSLIGFGGVHRQGAFVRRLTSVTIDEQEMGFRAVDLLHRMRTRELPLEHDEIQEMPLGLSAGETLQSEA